MDLGQVFTGKVTAEYMVSLFTLDKYAKILDPCFGDGAFLTALTGGGWKKIFGYEIDPNLYFSCKERFPTCALRKGDFLSSDRRDRYDGVIMNPPYIRYERIDDLAELGVSRETLALDPLFSSLPPTANLYMYFVLKAVSVLRKGGELIVIFPGSWLSARSGNAFKDALYRECSVERRIHISGNVFEQSPLVDVFILKLKKSGIQKRIVTEYVKLENNQVIPVSRKNKVFSVHFGKRFEDIGQIRRGLTTGCNELFINPPSALGERYAVDILSSPKQIRGYTTKDADCDSLLTVIPEEMDDPDVCRFINEWKGKILRRGKPKALAEKIMRGDEWWYQVPLFVCEGILFSYTVCEDMKFVMNTSADTCVDMVGDNFYIIYPSIDQWLCFALLNNYYTYYQLETFGKKYGGGLLKLQRYDLERLQIPDFDSFSKEDTERLISLAKKLADTGSDSVVAEITRALSGYCDISFEEISDALNTAVKNRLEGT